MPNEIEVRISGTDDLTPKINAATNAMREMEAAAKKLESSFGGGGLREYGMVLENWAAKALKAEQASKALAASQLEAAKAAQVMAMFEQRNAEVMEHVAERERRSLRQPQIVGPPSGRGGRGGGGGGAGEEGGMMGGMSKEFMSGINYMIGAWSVGFTVAQIALDKLTESVQQAGSMFTFFSQEMHKSGATAKEVGQDFVNLQTIASQTGMKFSEVVQKRQELMGTGMSKAEAERSTQFIGQYLKTYGDDLTDVIAKSRLFKASAEDILKIAQPGTPFAALRAPAAAYQAREAAKPVEQFRLQEAEQAEQRAFQDKTHHAEHLFSMQKMQLTELVHDRQQAESRALEDATRAIEYEQEDRHRATQWEMEDRFRAINREMELRHQMIEQSMADQHRLAAQREQDEDTAHSRAVSHASAISGLAENILTGSPIMGKGGKDVTGTVLGAVPASYISTLKDQMEAGAKAMGLSMDAARQLVQLGVLSPGSLIQAGEEERQDERKAAGRKREQEDIQTNRKLQKEALDERIRQEDEIRQTERRFALEQVATQRAIAQEQTQLARAHQDEQQEVARTVAHAEAEYAEVVYQTQTEMSRRYQDARMDMERETLMGILRLNIDAIAAKEKAEEEQFKQTQARMEWVAKMTGRKPEDLPQYKAPEAGEEQQKLQSIYDDLAGSMKRTVGQTKEHNEATSDLGSNNKELSDKIDSVHDRYQSLIDKEREKTDSTREHAQAVQDLSDSYKTLDQQYQKQAGGGAGGAGGGVGGAGGQPADFAFPWSAGQAMGRAWTATELKEHAAHERAYQEKYGAPSPWARSEERSGMPGGGRSEREIQGVAGATDQEAAIAAMSGAHPGAPAPGTPAKSDELSQALGEHFKQATQSGAPATEATLTLVAQLLQRTLSTS